MKSAQFGQDLTLAWVVEKKARRCNGEGGQHRLQSTLGNMRFDRRAGYLCKSQTLDCRSDKCRISCAISGPETTASMALLPSTNDQGATDPFGRRMRRQAWPRRSLIRFGRVRERR